MAPSTARARGHEGPGIHSEAESGVNSVFVLSSHAAVTNARFVSRRRPFTITRRRVSGLNGGAASRPQRVKSGGPLYGERGNFRILRVGSNIITRRFPFLT